ncbi:hypothetical protein EIMP300_34210 [Escherichia coli]|uniref:TmcA/NAT10 N-terminal domain-containing protein n=1 Tax=Escherichia coli TaxID=562 RepID=A0A8S0FQ58_ECOLX|nr:hypothetical protein EIMP300_34210 [Escherichia coli]
MIMRLSCVMPYLATGCGFRRSQMLKTNVPHCSPSALQTLLGREFRHAVFDARHGFDAAAFAALSGTLKAGSWLVLLLPVWDEWENQPDADSLRWSDCPDPIATPHFVQHFKRVLTANNDAILWRQNQPFSLAHFTPRTDWHPATGAPQPEQQQLLQQLLTMPPGVAAVTAARGRGKSALAGQLISRIAGSAIVTAKNTSASLARKSGNGCTGTICGREVSLYCAGCLVSQR